MLLMHVWSAFLSLSSGRQSGFSGPSPLTYTEIKSWSELTATPLKPFEVDSIKLLDQEYLRIANV